MIWRKLADRALPAEALSGIGRVLWRTTGPGDPATGAAVQIAHTIQVSPSLLGIWVSPNGFLWKPWPNLTDLLSMAFADIRVSAEPVMLNGGEIGYFRFDG